MLCIFNQWDRKEKMSNHKQIIAAFAEFTGAINQFKQLTKDDAEIQQINS
jgi:hypothetical protein